MRLQNSTPEGSGRAIAFLAWGALLSFLAAVAVATCHPKLLQLVTSDGDLSAGHSRMHWLDTVSLFQHSGPFVEADRERRPLDTSDDQRLPSALAGKDGAVTVIIKNEQQNTRSQFVSGATVIINQFRSELGAGQSLVSTLLILVGGIALLTCLACGISGALASPSSGDGQRDGLVAKPVKLHAKSFNPGSPMSSLQSISQSFAQQQTSQAKSSPNGQKRSPQQMSGSRPGSTTNIPGSTAVLGTAPGLGPMFQPNVDAYFSVELSGLATMFENGRVDVVGMSGHPLLHASVQQGVLGKELEVTVAHPGSQPRVTIGPCLGGGDGGGNSPAGSLEIRGPAGVHYGMLEPKRKDSYMFAVTQAGKPLMFIDGESSGLELTVLQADGQEVASVACGGENHGGVEHLELRVQAGTDPVLVLACVLSVVILSPGA